MENVKGIIFDWVGTLSDGSRKLFPCSMRVIEKLSKNYRLGLVSLAGHGVEARKEDIESTGVLRYLKSVIIDTSKNQEHYLRCMREMETTPETTLIVDDRTQRGIMIGNQIGCRTFWIKDGPYSHEIPDEKTGQPTKIINSVEDLLNII